MLHEEFKPEIPSHCLGENVDFAIFSISGHLGFSTTPNFIILKPCSQIMVHVKSGKHGCRGFRE